MDVQNYQNKALFCSFNLIFFKKNMYLFLFRFRVKRDLISATMKLLWVVMLFAGTVLADADDDEKKESVGTVVGIDLGTTYSW